MKTKFEINFAGAVSQFEQAIKKFQIRKIIYRTIFRGKGLEFDSYRNFEKDDDSSLIDWKASLRANKLLAKQYIEERDINFYFVLDVSRSMLFGSGKKLKAEYAAEVVAALSHLILESGDNVGLIMFTDHEVKVVRPSKSKNQFLLFNKFLEDPSLYGEKMDFDKMVNYTLNTVNSPFSVVILISDFLHISGACEKCLKLLGTKFETLALMVRDPFDEALPESNYQMVVQDPNSGRQIVIDTSIASKRYRENVLNQKSFLKKLFLESNIDILELKTNVNFVLPTVSFLKSRARGSVE